MALEAEEIASIYAEIGRGVPKEESRLAGRSEEHSEAWDEAEILMGLEKKRGGAVDIVHEAVGGE